MKLSSSKSKISVALAFLVIVVLGTFWLGFNFGTKNINDKDLITVLTNKDSDGTSLNFADKPAVSAQVDFAPFWKTWRILDENFVPVSTSSIDQINPDTKVVKSIQGLVTSYNDPYTVFFNAEESKNFKAAVSGTFEGIGAVLSLAGGYPTVTKLLPDMPAAKAHMQVGDVITAVDGKVTARLALEDAIKMIRGPKDTDITLSVIHQGDNKFVNIKVTRGSIAVPSTADAATSRVQEAINHVVDRIKVAPANLDTVGKVVSSVVGSGEVVANVNSAIKNVANVASSMGLLNPKVADATVSIPTSKPILPPTEPQVSAKDFFVFGLSIFSGTSESAFKDEMEKFKKSGTKNLIIDLRNNGGGYMDAAVDMASYFLPEGDVVVTERRGKGASQQEIKHVSKGYKLFDHPEDIKIVILVNGNTASAAEILSGALKEYGRAILVGEKTFGKGSVQQLVDITDTMSLKITIARWYTPHGVSLSGNGLDPDYVVVPTVDNTKDGVDPVFEKAIEVLLKK